MITIPTSQRPLIKSLVGQDCLIYAATAVKVYLAKSGSKAWKDMNWEGALVILRDSIKNGALFFRLLDLKKKSVVWEQEIYKELHYYKDTEQFYSFASNNGMVGFSFADSDEASQFADIVRKRREKIDTYFEPFLQSGKLTSKRSSFRLSNFSFWKNKTPSDNKKATKDDIGAPVDFRHIGHIGFDPKKGYNSENIPEEWNVIFQKAGVTQKQLENKETAKFIANFVADQEAVLTDQPLSNLSLKEQPVEVVERPRRKPIPPPPPPARAKSPSPPLKLSHVDLGKGPQRAKEPSDATKLDKPKGKVPPSPPPSTPVPSIPLHTSPPPPPPPPPPPLQVMPTKPKADETLSQSDPNFIKSASASTPVLSSRSSKSPSRGADNRGQLLTSIRTTGQSALRKAEARKEASPLPSEESTDMIAGLLAKALSDRNKKLFSAEEESDEDDQW